MALGGASREKADAFLDDQRALIAKQGHLVDLQAKELSHELKLRHWSLQLRHGSAILKFALEISVAFIAVGLACLIGVAVWSAAHDDGLVIEAFSVPPDLAAKCVTGQVVATQMLDKLSGLQTGSAYASRAPASYANNWDNDLKVEIPETGVSIGEFNRYLHQVLGHQTHITGEVVRSGDGIAVTARFGADAGPRFSGAEADLDGLLQKTAEEIYGRTQPYRYGIYLQNQGKIAEAEAFLSSHTNIGSSTEQAWVYAGWYVTLTAQGRYQEAARAAKAAVAANPDVVFGWNRISSSAQTFGQPEAGLATERTIQRLLNGSVLKDLRPDAVTVQKSTVMNRIADLLGAYADETNRLNLSDDPLQQMQTVLATPGQNLINSIVAPINFASRLARMHDLAAARRITAREPAYRDAIRQILATRPDARGQAIFDLPAQTFRNAELAIALAEEDWGRIRQIAPVMEAAEPKLNAAYLGGSITGYAPTGRWPLLAYAEARSGDFAAAHALIDRTPGDCDLCLRMRARIDAAESNAGGADYWFARAVALSPSIPFAHEDWGRVLLARGKPDDAIAQFTIANKNGPHFADALEGWGEALMAKNQSHLALEKFVEAEKYAPNWGRLHLKWGEALVYAGKRDEAKAQFARAAALDLTQSEKSELAKVSHG